MCLWQSWDLNPGLMTEGAGLRWGILVARAADVSLLAQGDARTPEPAPRRADSACIDMGVLMGFDGEQRGEAWGARVRTPSLPICLMWLRNTLSTSWEISEMLCDVDKWLPLSGPWSPLIPEDISSPMKSALEFSTCPSAPL